MSSPLSTGGAGTVFEQHVDAYWLAQLLVGGIPPILLDCTVLEVHLQTNHLGWNTDDFLVIGQNGSGTRRKLAGQVKRSLMVSAADEECRKTVEDYWRDLNNTQQFASDTDRFALVTLQGTTSLLGHFTALLDCARAAHDGADFERRLAIPGFINARAVHYCDQVRTIIGEIEGHPVTAAGVWPLLRVLHVISLDLTSATRQTEAAIKSFLAYTTQEQDPVGAAEATWNALVSEASEGAPRALSYKRSDLPATLQQRHSAMGGTEHRALRALAEHTMPILEGIGSTIGTALHLGRDRLMQQVIEQLESTQVVLISGTAGSGKSTLAKDVISTLKPDHFAFAFRAVEFAHAHLDETLSNSQIPANAGRIAAILASQDRKVLLIESVERLLESTTRDAFSDLVTLVARDKTWHVLLTCRDYSADVVRTSLLGMRGLGHSVVKVPPLDDEELGQAKVTYPALTRPLANPPLRRLLSNPYVLDMALRVQWSEGRPLPQTERELRDLFWREVVREEQERTGGMPRKREEALVRIALRRARALTSYVGSTDLDPAVLEVLRRDSLVVSPPETDVLVAPAHDVLEDWAILRWIGEQYTVHGGSIRDVSVAIGTYPAVRRTYRKWVAELVERDQDAADGLFRAAVRDSELSAQFRDDTLVSLLRSPSATAFLERHTAEFLTDGMQVLRRVIHLLRVACVTAPDWLVSVQSLPSVMNVPEGPAWGTVLRLVHTHVASFEEESGLLLLGLVEDWARGVAWWNPYSDGAEAAAGIAYWLLHWFGGHGAEKERKRTLQVIAKIPNADRERFTALLQRGGQRPREQIADELLEIVLAGMEGAAAARDMPELVAAAASRYLLVSEDDLRRDWGYESSSDLGPRFGIREGREHAFFPASAYCGPFLPLLRAHPYEGLNWIVRVLNHSAEWYAHPRTHQDRLEPASELMLRFAYGTSRKQWCNSRLWNLYRGTSVGPNALQCLLMALERWLLDVAEKQPQHLDAILLRILRESESGAATAVVASVSTAFPRACGESLLVLLRSPECILLDRQRLASESSAFSKSSGLFSLSNAGNEIYNGERKKADALPHRKQDLEAAIVSLQIGPLAARVHEVLDQHRAAMPPLEEQSDRDRVWRLALHRMDLRQYSVAEDELQSDAAGGAGTSSEDRRLQIRLSLNAAEPDVQEMVDHSAADYQVVSAQLGLLNWAHSVFTYDTSGDQDAAQWRHRLDGARATTGSKSGTQTDVGRDGPGIVAAVCVRDHWDEMSPEERNWCVTRLCDEVARTADNWDDTARVQQFPMSADRPCALVLPSLIGKPTTATQRRSVRRALAMAVTHPVNEVRHYAAMGVGRYLWRIDQRLAVRCVNAVASEAAMVQEAIEANRGRLYTERPISDDIDAAVAGRVRKLFHAADAIGETAYETMDPATPVGARANEWILSILAGAPQDGFAISGFERAARTLVGWWDSDRRARGNRQAPRPERNFFAESRLASLLPEFLLRTSFAAATAILQPVLGAIDRHPREVESILAWLILAEDRQPNTAQFWLLWDLFADAIKHAPWLPHLDGDSATGSGLVSKIFLEIQWNDGVRHWRTLEGHAHHIHALFEDLPASSVVIEDYLRFLYRVGEQSLPEAFIRIAKRLRDGNQRELLRRTNSVFLLESMLQRYVYGKPLELKQEQGLRESALFLLDALVENGSSAAFRMRDDFVTPLAA